MDKLFAVLKLVNHLKQKRVLTFVIIRTDTDLCLKRLIKKGIQETSYVKI